MPVVETESKPLLPAPMQLSRSSTAFRPQSSPAACDRTPIRAAPARQSPLQSHASCSATTRQAVPRPLPAPPPPQYPCRSRSAGRSSVRAASACFRRKRPLGIWPRLSWPCLPTPRAPRCIRRSPSGPLPLPAIAQRLHTARRRAASTQKTIPGQSESPRPLRPCEMRRSAVPLSCGAPRPAPCLLPSRNPPSTAPLQSASTWDSPCRPSRPRRVRRSSRTVADQAGSLSQSIAAPAYRYTARARLRAPSACSCTSPAKTSDSTPTADAPMSAAAESCSHWPRLSPRRSPPSQIGCEAIAATPPHSPPDRKAAVPKPCSKAQISPNRLLGSGSRLHTRIARPHAPILPFP